MVLGSLASGALSPNGSEAPGSGLVSTGLEGDAIGVIVSRGPLPVSVSRVVLRRDGKRVTGKAYVAARW